MSFEVKVYNAVENARTLEDFDYLLEKIESTSFINRRTKQGRELTEKLVDHVLTKRNEAITKFGLVPF